MSPMPHGNSLHPRPDDALDPRCNSPSPDPASSSHSIASSGSRFIETELMDTARLNKVYAQMFPTNLPRRPLDDANDLDNDDDALENLSDKDQVSSPQQQRRLDPTSLASSSSPHPLPSSKPSSPSLNLTSLAMHRVQAFEYNSFFRKLHHLCLPLTLFYHVPCQVYLDYNIIYMLVQISRNSKHTWWIAVAGYGLCTFLWLFGIIFFYELLFALMQLWNNPDRSMNLDTYFSTALNNMARLRNYSVFSFFNRLKNSAWTGISSLYPSQPRLAIAEACFWFCQNWPTVFLSIPRAGLSLAVLLWTAPDGYPPSQRDDSYFRPNGKLKKFSQVILAINVAWTGWRLLLLIIAWIGVLLSDFSLERELPALDESTSTVVRPLIDSCAEASSTPSRIDRIASLYIPSLSRLQRHANVRRSYLIAKYIPISDLEYNTYIYPAHDPEKSRPGTAGGFSGNYMQQQRPHPISNIIEKSMSVYPRNMATASSQFATNSTRPSTAPAQTSTPQNQQKGTIATTTTTAAADDRYTSFNAHRYSLKRAKTSAGASGSGSGSGSASGHNTNSSSTSTTPSVILVPHSRQSGSRPGSNPSTGSRRSSRNISPTSEQQLQQTEGLGRVDVTFVGDGENEQQQDSGNKNAAADEEDNYSNKQFANVPLATDHSHHNSLTINTSTLTEKRDSNMSLLTVGSAKSGDKRDSTALTSVSSFQSSCETPSPVLGISSDWKHVKIESRQPVLLANTETPLMNIPVSTSNDNDNDNDKNCNNTDTNDNVTDKKTDNINMDAAPSSSGDAQQRLSSPTPSSNSSSESGDDQIEDSARDNRRLSDRFIFSNLTGEGLRSIAEEEEEEEEEDNGVGGGNGDDGSSSRADSLQQQQKRLRRVSAFGTLPSPTSLGTNYNDVGGSGSGSGDGRRTSVKNSTGSGSTSGSLTSTCQKFPMIFNDDGTEVEQQLLQQAEQEQSSSHSSRPQQQCNISSNTHLHEDTRTSNDIIIDHDTTTTTSNHHEPQYLFTRPPNYPMPPSSLDLDVPLDEEEEEEEDNVNENYDDNDDGGDTTIGHNSHEQAQDQLLSTTTGANDDDNNARNVYPIVFPAVSSSSLASTTTARSYRSSTSNSHHSTSQERNNVESSPQQPQAQSEIPQLRQQPSLFTSTSASASFTTAPSYYEEDDQDHQDHPENQEGLVEK